MYLLTFQTLFSWLIFCFFFVPFFSFLWFNDFLFGSDGKVSACSVGNLGSIPELGRSPGEGNGNPLQYSCLENSMDGGAWAAVHGVAKSWTRLSNFTLASILCLCSLLCRFCESIVCFVFALFFKYVNPFLYLLALD